MKLHILAPLLLLLLSHSLIAQLDFSKNPHPVSPLLQTMDSKISNGDYERITSVLIAKDGNVVFERYYNGNDNASLHNTRSATKTIATLLTGIAIQKEFINSEKDKIFDYLGHKLPMQNADLRKENTTIEDLLTMSSLFECNDNNSFSRGNEERMYIIEDWTQFFVDLPVRSFPFSPKPEELPYGRSFSYCSAGASTMAEVIQSAVGMPLDRFAAQYLFEPLEIKNYKLHYTPMKILNTAGGSEYQSRDFLKLIQLCLQNGQWNEKQLIPEDWLQKATTAKVNAWEGMDYGYLFWIRDYGKDKKTKCFAMAGNGGNKIVAFPELDLAVVLTATNYNNRKAHGYTDEILNDFIVPAFMD